MSRSKSRCSSYSFPQPPTSSKLERPPTEPARLRQILQKQDISPILKLHKHLSSRSLSRSLSHRPHPHIAPSITRSLCCLTYLYRSNLFGQSFVIHIPLYLPLVVLLHRSPCWLLRRNPWFIAAPKSLLHCCTEVPNPSGCCRSSTRCCQAYYCRRSPLAVAEVHIPLFAAEAKFPSPLATVHLLPKGSSHRHCCRSEDSITSCCLQSRNRSTSWSCWYWVANLEVWVAEVLQPNTVSRCSSHIEFLWPDRVDRIVEIPQILRHRTTDRSCWELPLKSQIEVVSKSLYSVVVAQRSQIFSLHSQVPKLYNL